MAYHDDLLAQALQLIHVPQPSQLTLRRAVSAAYYAVFHYLIAESAFNWSSVPLRTALGRAYDHGTMKTASNRILNPKDFPYAGDDPMVVTNLRFVAQTFSQLQEDRHFADYNLTKDLDPVEALTQVKSAEKFFNTWPTIRGEQIAQGALRAWAWGASRALDYFETDKTVDAKRVGVEGHSRYGKATIVAMAYDPRFAIAYVSSSGEGGAKIHRRNWGELVENVAATSEYHWMAGNFLKYAGPLNWNDLPVDSHELVALCAPRPVFISGGATDKGDGWVDAKGMFLAAAGAGPVYKLLGKKDMGASEFPPIETPLIDGDVAFRQHTGGHTPAPNWPTFITFADRYIGKPAPTQATAR